MVQTDISGTSSGKSGISGNLGGMGKDLVNKVDDIERTVEDYTTKFRPKDYLTFAFGSMAVSAVLQLAGRKEDALFVGQWAPSLLALAIYDDFRRGDFGRRDVH